MWVGKPVDPDGGEGVLAWIVAALGGFVWGTLPWGQWTLHWLHRGDVRRLSPHNIGLRGLLRRVGWGTGILLACEDVLKGAAAVWVPIALGLSPWAVTAGVVATLLGHLYSPYFLIRDGAPFRSRGGAVVLGLWLGMFAGGLVLPAGFAAPLGLWVVVMALPRLWGQPWGYLSFASAVLSASAGLVLLVSAAATPLVVLSLALMVLVPWRSKEHLARIVDGVEPHLWDDASGGAVDQVSCAFLIHPMHQADWWKARRFRWMRFLVRRGILRLKALEWISRFMRPMKVDEIRGIVTPDGTRVRVHLLAAPMLPATIKHEATLALRRAVQASRLADQLGAQVLGLGAYWSVVGDKGLAVQRKAPVPVTNGGAYTSGAVGESVPRVIERLRDRGLDLSQSTAAVVGANGVVGFGICRIIAPLVGVLIMVGIHADRLEQSAEAIRHRFPSTMVETSTDQEDLLRANVIFTATSQVEPVIFARHVREGTLIYDVGRPADVDPSVSAVPGVEVVPGGVVELPGDVSFHVDLGYGCRLVPACLAEAILIALDGSYDRCTVGMAARAENIRYFVERGHVHGFRVVTAGTGAEPAISDPVAI